MKKFSTILFLALITVVIFARDSKTLNVPLTGTPTTLIKSYDKNKVDNLFGNINSNNQSLPLTVLNETDLGVKIPEGMDAVSFGDFDNDGDLDLLVSGEYEMGMPGGKYLTKIYKNDNGKFIEYPSNLVGVSSKNVGWFDIDHDGDLDIYVFGLSGYDEDFQQIFVNKLYINNNGVFTEKEFPIKIYPGDGIAWGDYDNDGDLDLALSGSSAFGTYYTKVYENQKGTFVEKANLLGLGYGAPTISWFDFDKDGDLDLLNTGNSTAGATKNLTTKVYINKNGIFVDSNFDLPGVDYAITNFADYNNDGYYDILLAGDGYYNKIGQRITNVICNKDLSYKYSDTLNLKLTKTYYGNALTADFNNDGLLDILMTGTFGTYPRDNTIPKLYINNSIGYDTLNYSFPAAVKNMAVADYDNDGDLDIILSGKKGSYLDGIYSTKFYRNDINVSNAPPVCPDTYQTIIQGDSVILSWSKADDDGLSDTKTNRNSLTYNVYLKYNDSLIISPNSRIENGFRKIVDYGNAQLDTFKIIKKLSSGHYEWGVQTIDNSYIGSSFSTVQTFDYCSNFKIDAGADKSIICGGKVQIDSPLISNAGIGTLTYHWTPSTGLNNDTIPNPIASVTQNTKYYITVMSSNGCSAIDSLTVLVNALTANAGEDKTIICGGTAQLNTVTTNYTGTGMLKYKWTPSTGLNNDTIANPTATVINDVTYTVTVTTPNGCTATDDVKVTVNTLTANAGEDKIIICGGIAQLNTVTTNYTGAGTLKYKWTPSTGLNNDTIANPTATATSDKIYIVTVTTPNGCTATDEIKVTVNPLTVNAGDDKTIICGGTVQLNTVATNYIGSEILKYKWTPSTGLNNDTIPNPTATLINNITYTVTVTTPNGGCNATDELGVTIKAMDKPEIGMVGVSSNNKNLIAWNKPVSSGIESYYIYRETNVTNVYEKIGLVPYDSLSIYVDNQSLPDVQSNKYKLSIYDRHGLESPQSDYHKTMHLAINKGMGTTWNLSWEAYEGFVVSTYNIYRGTTPANLTLLGSTSGGNTQYNDLNAPTGDIYYQLEVISPNNVNPTKVPGSLQKAKGEKNDLFNSLASYNSSRSNIASNVLNGIYELNDERSNIRIYPNPVKNELNIDFEGGSAFEIMNLMGQIVYNGNLIKNSIVQTSNLSSGVYLIKFKTGKSFEYKKILKE